MDVKRNVDGVVIFGGEKAFKIVFYCVKYTRIFQMTYTFNDCVTGLTIEKIYEYNNNKI